MAYAGLGSSFNVTIVPAFNENASLFGEYYDGTVTNWTALSNATGQPDVDVNRTELSLSEPVHVTSGDCEVKTAPSPTAGEGNDVIPDDGAPTPAVDDEDGAAETPTEDEQTEAADTGPTE